MRKKIVILIALVVLAILAAIRRPSDSSIKFSEQQKKLAKPQGTAK